MYHLFGKRKIWKKKVITPKTIVLMCPAAHALYFNWFDPTCFLTSFFFLCSGATVVLVIGVALDAASDLAASCSTIWLLPLGTVDIVDIDWLVISLSLIRIFCIPPNNSSLFFQLLPFWIEIYCLKACLFYVSIHELLYNRDIKFNTISTNQLLQLEPLVVWLVRIYMLPTTPSQCCFRR